MSKTVIINVLKKEFFDDCHIKGTINVPRPELSQYAQNNLNKDDEILIYCAHTECPESGKAYEILKDLGYTNVKAYEGGMREWLQLGYPAEGACQQEYLQEPHKEVPPKPGVNTISAQDLKKKLEE